MDEITPNYMLGLAALVISFVVLFYVPIVYFWLKSAKVKRNQNK